MLSLDHGPDVEVRRPVFDFGEKTFPTEPTATIRVARKLNPPQRIASDNGGNAYTQDGVLYTARPGHPHYREFDVADGDKVSLPEGDFIVRGRPENDYLHPGNGHEFGVRRHRIEST